MKWIKLGIISFVVLFMVIFLMSLLIPGHVRISRAVNIRVPQRPFSQALANLTSWHEWNQLVQGVPQNKWQYRDHILSSDSLTITLTLATSDTVRTVWRNKSGREIAGVFALEQAGDLTIVQWYFDFHQRWYPWEKIASINLDKQFGPLMERSLDSLKKIMERVQ